MADCPDLYGSLKTVGGRRSSQGGRSEPERGGRNRVLRNQTAKKTRVGSQYYSRDSTPVSWDSFHPVLPFVCFFFLLLPKFDFWTQVYRYLNFDKIFCE